VLGIAPHQWPFTRGLLGGGDVKLVGALGCWLGPVGVVRLLLLGSIAGGLLAALFLARLGREERAQVGRNLGTFVRAGELPVEAVERLERSRGVPYGVALAAACAWLLGAGGGP
jgi:prepilin peptidase CpaA